MKERYKVFLRSTEGKNAEGYDMINIPHHIWKEMEWKLNENLIIDTIKDGLEHSIMIKKEKK